MGNTLLLRQRIYSNRSSSSWISSLSVMGGTTGPRPSTIGNALDEIAVPSLGIRRQHRFNLAGTESISRFHGVCPCSAVFRL